MEAVLCEVDRYDEEIAELSARPEAARPANNCPQERIHVVSMLSNSRQKGTGPAPRGERRSRGPCLAAHPR